MKQELSGTEKTIKQDYYADQRQRDIERKAWKLFLSAWENSTISNSDLANRALNAAIAFYAEADKRRSE